MRIWIIPILVCGVILGLEYALSPTDAQSTTPAGRPTAVVPYGPAMPHNFVDRQPGVPYLTPPATRPVDWLVEHPPISPNASPEAKALLHFLYAISLNHTLTGQHNFPGDQEFSTDTVAGITGKTPAIYGTDFGFANAGSKDSAFNRQANVQELIKQYKAGSIIVLCWHAVPPVADEPTQFQGGVLSHLTDDQWKDVLTPGTALNQRWAAQVDAIAGYLKQLEAAHVPVLFRPYHEMNDEYFWWGGRRGDLGSKTIFQNIWKRLIEVHHLTNIIWVWNIHMPDRPDKQFIDFFPGQQYVDVLSVDNYDRFYQKLYDDLNALSDGKVMAIAEVGPTPPISIYATQPKWAFWMHWALDRPRGGGRRGGRGGGYGDGAPDLSNPQAYAQIIDDPRMLSLQDPLYIEMTNPIRAASGFPAITPPLPPATQPTRGTP